MRHFEQFYIGVDLLFVTFTAPCGRQLLVAGSSLWQAAQQLHCFLEALVIPRFTPAVPLEFVHASKFFNLQAVHSVFWCAGCLMFQLKLIPKEFRCPHA
jgi:fucose permease